MTIRALMLATSLGVALLSEPLVAEVPERADIAKELTWDLSPMFRSGSDWDAARADFEQRLPGLGDYRGRLADSGETLLAALNARDAIARALENLYVYAGLSVAEDSRISASNARFSVARSLLARYQETIAYMAPELIAIEPAKLRSMIEQTPGLAVYRHHLDDMIRMQPHTLGESEEKLLAMSQDALGNFSSVFNTLSDADLRLGTILDEQDKEVELTSSRYSAFQSSPDRSVREAAWKGIHKAYASYNATLASNYEGHVKGRIFLARARGFASAAQAATFGNAIPLEVYRNVVDTAREGAGPMQRYLDVRRRMLGVKTLQTWDLYAPVVETDKRYSFEQAKEIVADALQPLGADYIDAYWRGFAERWVDAMPNRGKRSGAFSWGTYDSRPYLMMNYQGTLNDVSTLAHEYGHSIHSYLSRGSQPYVYADYTTFIAEVASMTNEAILYEKLLASAKTPQERVVLLVEYLDNARASFYRQAAFADFELRAHTLAESGEALSAETLNGLYADVFKAFYGDAVAVTDLNDVEWSRIPHFLRTDNFYVFQYATSWAASTALAKQILEEGAPARQRYLTLLRSGSSDYPIALLKHAGVDMSDPQPIVDAIAVFDARVSDLESALTQLE